MNYKVSEEFNILDTDELNEVLIHLEKIELDAIKILKIIRNPIYQIHIYCNCWDTLVDIQFQIRDFRFMLSKNTGVFNREKYKAFLDHVHLSLEHCNKAAENPYPNCRLKNADQSHL
ncbi:PRESAN domain-containing protein [Caenorhabditis elegans]|uniref:PRESAN domain-containing protein n=1 Tax=Caenorhabditis elegans TaxID=6239 RepID=Q17775_CAEEL|nr:PRESAN domain-containing protein [Caenorhabditis elegans]CAA86409.1 PRESAN domain-containing protein [Caenorhabditis elegans]|eukprot:NP_509600.1 Uncharacterized protein CELE_C07B5.2 [Caenorhabditis elegans]